MKNLIKLEELGLFVLSSYLICTMEMQLSWWIYILLFFTPDIGMTGYLVNPKVGAVTYNLLHHQAVASTLLIIGFVQSNDYFLLAGLMIFAHSALDRVLGFGLKYPDSFKHTSLGYIGGPPSEKVD
jgi:hypothetical protein